MPYFRTIICFHKRWIFSLEGSYLATGDFQSFPLSVLHTEFSFSLKYQIKVVSQGLAWFTVTHTLHVLGIFTPIFFY